MHHLPSKLVASEEDKSNVSEAPAFQHGKLVGLDGLRAVAVLLVILFHQDVLPGGWIGVQIFFVLSGYLITGLLFEARDNPLGRYLKSFYGRRALRIFPLYYAYLAAVGGLLWLGVDLPNVAAGMPAAATYTYNLWHASDAFARSLVLTHLWSLSAEEQFYLFWPLLIFFCPRDRIRGVLIAIVVCGPIVRFLTERILSQPGLPVYAYKHVVVYVLTTSHLDAFAIGGFARLFPWGGARKALWATFAALLVGGLLVKFSVGLSWSTLGYPLALPHRYGFIWGYTLLNVCSALLIDCLVSRQFFPRIFEASSLSYLGKISYGIYVLHYPIQFAVERVVPGAPLPVRIAIQLILTILLADISFRYFESKILVFKDRWFPTPHARQSSLAGTLSATSSR